MSISMSSILKRLAIFLFSILLTLVLPFVLILATPLFLYRCIISGLGPIFRPTLARIIPPFDASFALHNVYKNPIHGITYVLVLSKPVELSVLRESFQRKVIEHRNFSGELAYPELMDKVSAWMGYLFWEHVEFDLNSHFRLYEGKSVKLGQDFVKETIQEFLDQPFKAGASPWEIFYAPRTRTNEYYLIVRFHHVLSGLGFQSVLGTWCCCEGIQGSSAEVSEMPQVTKTNPWNMCRVGVSTLQFLILGPYLLVSQAANSSDDNEWSRKRTQWTGKLMVKISEEIPAELLKEVRKGLGLVSSTAIFLSCLSGGLQFGMKEIGMEVVGKIHCMVPIAMGNPFGKLRNLFTAVSIELPLTEPDPIKRLQKLDRTMKHKRLPLILHANWTASNLVCRLPICLMAKVEQHYGPCTFFSNHYGPTQELILCKSRITTLHGGYRILPGLGPVCQVSSYNGSFKFVLAADKGVISNQDTLRQILEQILKEFQHLRNLTV